MPFVPSSNDDRAGSGMLADMPQITGRQTIIFGDGQENMHDRHRGTIRMP